MDGRQQTIMRIAECRTICNGPRQFSVNIHRTAAHPLGDTAAAFYYAAAGPDQNLVTHGLAARDAQYLHRKRLYRITGNNSFCITPHPRFQIIYRHQGCPRENLNLNR